MRRYDDAARAALARLRAYLWLEVDETLGHHPAEIAECAIRAIDAARWAARVMRPRRNDVDRG